MIPTSTVKLPLNYRTVPRAPTGFPLGGQQGRVGIKKCWYPGGTPKNTYRQLSLLSTVTRLPVSNLNRQIRQTPAYGINATRMWLWGANSGAISWPGCLAHPTGGGMQPPFPLLAAPRAFFLFSGIYFPIVVINRHMFPTPNAVLVIPCSPK